MSFHTSHAGRIQRALCVVLAVSLAVGPSLNVWAQESGAQSPAREAPKPAPAAPAAPIDTTYVAPGAVALIVLRPAQLMKSPMSDFLPAEVATAAGLKYLGIDPANVEQATVFADPTNPTAPNYGLAIKFVQPMQSFNPWPALRDINTQLDELKLAGKKYLKSRNPMLPSFYAPNDRTLLVAPDATIKQFVEAPAQAKTGAVLERIKNAPGGNDLYVVVNIASLRPLIQMGLAQARREVPPEAQPFVKAVNLVSSVELTLNISKPVPSSLVVHANDAEAAKQIETMISDAAAKAREQMRAQWAKHEASNDPVERAFAHYMERMSDRWSRPVTPTRKGADLTFFRFEVGGSPQQQLVTVAVAGVLVALLLPAIQAAREAARRNQSLSNIRQLLLGISMYEGAHQFFPAHAIYSKDGQPLLSWRVAILPYIGRQDLYNQFDLDEPWNSEHNRALIAGMPPVFQNPNRSLPPGKTNYLAVVGKECVFDGTSKGMSLRDVKDGLSTTMMVVEANADKAVDWTKPDDLHYDATNPKAGLGGIRPGGWLAGFTDGHTQFISNNIDISKLRAFFTRAGGEYISNF